jgi:hypothetical protein
MTYLLTQQEAEELVADRLYGYGEQVNPFTYEGGVYDFDITEARAEIEMFLATLNRLIDPDSIRIKPDRLDEMDVPCVAITIKTGDQP